MYNPIVHIKEYFVNIDGCPGYSITKRNSQHNLVILSPQHRMHSVPLSAHFLILLYVFVIYYCLRSRPGDPDVVSPLVVMLKLQDDRMTG